MSAFAMSILLATIISHSQCVGRGLAIELTSYRSKSHFIVRLYQTIQSHNQELVTRVLEILDRRIDQKTLPAASRSEDQGGI